MDNKSSIPLYKDMIYEFIALIKFLNDKRNEANDIDINEESKIYEVNKFKNNSNNVVNYYSTGNRFME